VPTTLSKRHFSYTIKDFHQAFRRKKIKEEKKRRAEVISYDRYKVIMRSFFKELSKKIIYENFIFAMPYSLGSIYIKATKGTTRNFAIDYNKTKKLGKVVRHLNLHSFGTYYHFYWNTKLVLFKNKKYYIFKSIESKLSSKNGVGRRSLSNHIKELARDPERRSYIKI